MCGKRWNLQWAVVLTCGLAAGNDEWNSADLVQIWWNRADRISLDQVTVIKISLAGGRKCLVWEACVPLETADLFWDCFFFFNFFMRWALGQLLSLVASRFSPSCMESLPPPGLDYHFGWRLAFVWILERSGTFSETWGAFTSSCLSESAHALPFLASLHHLSTQITVQISLFRWLTIEGVTSCADRLPVACQLFLPHHITFSCLVPAETPRKQGLPCCGKASFFWPPGSCWVVRSASLS